MSYAAFGFAREVSPASLFAATPQCAQPCLLSDVVSAGCDLVDLTHIKECVCTNTTLLSAISTCVQKACTFQDQVAVRDAAADLLCASYPKPSRGNEVLLVTIVALALTIPVVTIRFWSRLATVGRLWWDDWTALLSLVLLVVLCIIGIYGSTIGFGMHYWDIEPRRAVTLLRLFWLVEIGYLLNLSVIKASIVLLYGRIFATPGWQKLTKCIAFVFLAQFVGFLFPLVFLCRPIASIWDRNVPGKCINVTAIGFAGAVVNIVEDLVILALPVPTLLRLQISKTRKLVVAGMFSIGSFSCITSMIRIKYLVTFSRTYDTTWDNVDVAIWSLVEVFSAIICGSIPPCRPLFTKLFRSLQSSGTRERFFCTTCNTRTCKSPDRVNEQPSEPSDSNVHLVHMNTSKELENGKR